MGTASLCFPHSEGGGGGAIRIQGDLRTANVEVLFYLSLVRTALDIIISVLIFVLVSVRCQSKLIFTRELI